MRTARSRPRGAAQPCAESDHSRRAEEARDSAIPEILLREASELLKMLADPTRLKILRALASGSLCVGHLSGALGMSQSAISHQLAALRATHLVDARREGKSVAYSLADDHVVTLLNTALEHAAERVPALGVAAREGPGSSP